MSELHRRSGRARKKPTAFWLGASLGKTRSREGALSSSDGSRVIASKRVRVSQNSQLSLSIPVEGTQEEEHGREQENEWDANTRRSVCSGIDSGAAVSPGTSALVHSDEDVGQIDHDCILTNVSSSSTDPRMTNRTRRTSTIDFRRFKPNLDTRESLIACSFSKSTLENKERARKALEIFASMHGIPDPVRVTKESSNRIMNLIAQYCKLGTRDTLKNDAMGALIQGLRHVYEEHGHTTPWCIVEGRASGNPLTGNRDIDRLRRAHRIHLASLGMLSVQALPMTVSIVCDLARKYWLKDNDESILLHAIPVTGLNLGMRFDDIGKLRTEHVSVTSGSIIVPESRKKA